MPIHAHVGGGLHRLVCQQPAATHAHAAAAAGMLQWGNVLLCKGKRVVDAAAAAGRDVAEVAPQAEGDFAAAEARYRESRRIKPDFYDAYVSLGNLEFERAKLALGLAVPPPQCAAPALPCACSCPCRGPSWWVFRVQEDVIADTHGGIWAFATRSQLTRGSKHHASQASPQQPDGAGLLCGCRGARLAPWACRAEMHVPLATP